MSDITIKQFANLLHSLAPDIPLTSNEIEQQIMIQGIDGFFDNVDVQYNSLIDLVKLLICFEKGAANIEP